MKSKEANENTVDPPVFEYLLTGLDMVDPRAGRDTDHVHVILR